MSDQSILSRREALLAAASISTVVATTQFASAEGPGKSQPVPDSERDQKPKPSEIPSRFKLSITLTDGQVVTFNATEAVIDFGATGQLLVRPTGVMPASGPKPRPQENDPFES